MTTRYKTPGEKAGVKRRAAAWRERRRALGLKPREIWLTDDEARVLRRVVDLWRGGDEHDFGERDQQAAMILKP